MRVAIFASAYHPSLGGVEELVRQMSHGLGRAGHHAIVLTNRWPRNLPAREDVDGVAVHRLAFRVPTGTWRSAVTCAATRRLIRRATEAILRQHRSEMIHVQCVSCQGPYAVAAADALGLPLVVSLQGELGMDAAGAFRGEGIGRRIMRKCLRRADAITACSRAALREAEQFMGEAFGAKGRVVYNGVDLAEFNPPALPHAHPRPYVLAMGRLVPQKGFDVLLRAFARCAGEDPAVGHDLILAGDGPERENLERLTRQLELGSRVSFFGRATRAQVAGLFAGCLFFVLPSRQEPMGIVNLEAMAAGKAIVAVDVGGVPEIVRPDVEGLLVPGGDVDAMAGAIRRLARDGALRERLGAAGAKRAAAFGWDAIVGEYLEVYRAAAATARGGPEVAGGRSRGTA
jgi:glycosyltransferase involved in cell wall biosynthesis